MDFRLWVLFWVSCFIFQGCATPARTFVSEEAVSPTERSSRRAAVPDAERDSIPPKVEANPVKPSVWTQWMGAFSKTPSKPRERIALPRTDRETAADEKPVESDPADDFDF